MMMTKTLNEAIVLNRQFFGMDRFKGVKRLYSARQVAEQQGTIYNDYSVAKQGSVDFFNLLREKFEKKEQITTFGPYTPSQAVMMKRAGIEGIYLGGWATSAKGSMDEDPGADLASYPLSQVPNEAAGIVRALITADKNQHYLRANMSEQQRENTETHDFRPFIIADADTGHGGEAHVRNLIRRFVEAGVTGYHIEDQKPGTKKCGHQGGKVLVSVDEQIKRLNAARYQLDIMRVPGLIVARTDAEAAALLENMSDERDQPFVLGATNLKVPSYKSVFLAFHQYLREQGVEAIYGHELYDLPEEEMERALSFLTETQLTFKILDEIDRLKSDVASEYEPIYHSLLGELVTVWESEAGVKTIGAAMVDLVKQHELKGIHYHLTSCDLKAFCQAATIRQVMEKARQLGIDLEWDCALAKTPEGYYQVKGGIPYAITKSLAVAPYCDLLWMETKTADLEDAKQFAEAIHKVYPEKMLAYNLSPSFNWDATGMSEQEMMDFPNELGKMGFVFNFITYGGHQIDGLASDEFAHLLKEEGMLALARTQRKFRLLDSPYKKPQTHVGGPRLDGALTATSGRTATTKAMGKGSTEFQHALHTELPVSLLNDWLKAWKGLHKIDFALKADLRPYRPGSTVMELCVRSGDRKMASMIFTRDVDRNGVEILTVKDQNTLESKWRRKRLMTLIHVFLINRYGSERVHYLSPTDENLKQVGAMKKMGLFDEVRSDSVLVLTAEVKVGKLQDLGKDERELISLLSENRVNAAIAV